ncbi:TIGR00282 family metallophosphoesterase [Sulfoacidibacillus thermotolerans]|uniref:Metallophosphoesterase n=1 Tax=Sulfoacidibacillus thermotolerans TaxID=1765684 RepID=A0A2U3DAD9_SULT2|nr:TIGR00282 family metallophosphoesterase [Sulfoacidibacillus thermotolerans]PWI58247.1 metallophosphoesterase [Sulfoacidibacillus thermotolerans]
MKILFIGDVTGKPGLLFVKDRLPQLISEFHPDLVIANAENSAVNGRGITASSVEYLYDCGVEILTLGNHVWDQREALGVIQADERIVRPANLPPGVPGRGYTVCRVAGRSVAIISLIGRTFMGLADCPFRAIDQIFSQLDPAIKHIFIDFHGEATSEKLALGFYVDGRASVVVGTHTHVQTADERILPKGTGYLTDVGMTGPRDGILGMKREVVIRRFLDQMPARFEVADGPRQFSAVLAVLDDQGSARSMERIYIAE